MKKILTVSLVAMMAVSAARADIASVEYVTKNYTTTTNMNAAIETAKGEAIAASDAKGSAAQALIDAKAYTDAEIGAIGETTVKDYVDSAVNALSGTGGAIAALDTRVGTAEGEIDALQTSLAAGGATANAIAEAKKAGTDAASALDAYKTTVTNTLKDYSTTAQMNTAITNSAVNTVATGTGNGTIAVDGEDVAVKGLGTAAYTDATAYDAAGAAGTAEANAKSYTDTKIGDLGTGVNTVVDYVVAAVGEVDGDLGGLQTTVTGHTTLIEALDTKLGKVEATADAAQTADEVATAIDNKVATLAKADTAVDKQFVTAVSETNGIISVSRAALQASDIPTIDQSQVSGLGDALNAKEATSNKLKSTDTTQVTDANKDTLFPTMGRMTNYVDDQITEYDNGLADTKDKVEQNFRKITNLQTVYDTLDVAVNNKQAKAGTNPYQIVKEDGTWATLTYGLPEKCKGDGVVCSLISTDGTVGWEVVAK